MSESLRIDSPLQRGGCRSPVLVNCDSALSQWRWGRRGERPPNFFDVRGGRHPFPGHGGGELAVGSKTDPSRASKVDFAPEPWATAAD